MNFAGVGARSDERRDNRHNRDEARICKQAGNFGHAANVLCAIFVSEAEIGIQPMANIVCIQYVGEAACI
jgi:hypothetical protein